MTRALPFLLVLSTIACGGLSPQLPTAVDTAAAVDTTTAVVATPRAVQGASFVGRSAAFILPNRCTEVAIIELALVAESTTGWTVGAVYRSADRGNPVAACTLPPDWAAKPDVKPEPLSDGFTAFVPAVNARPGDEGVVVVSARSPNGIEGVLELSLESWR